ncbi:unnamed protein product [Lepeophtheirus salmonis]|uniref:(salmon louse) hypothetical protein n=1 Tax=Lepeophtheirus salmonis TaxID=72036 RepID=A0A7R8CBQ5_LEPSM|nr:unnamed protein product [Lepeophtheirus salmonis]CAF2762966.1 unnamed protein product [Lepeophtheirus salmonis]
MNCVFEHYGNSTEIQACLSCFFPFQTDSIKCYDRFFPLRIRKKSCQLPKIEEINEDNRENVIFNLTACVDYNLRLKVIDSCVQSSLLSHYQELENVINWIDACTIKNMDTVFNSAINELEASTIGSVKKRIAKIFLIEYTTMKLQANVKKWSMERLRSAENAITCSNKHLNPVFSKCFNSENFSSKTFTTVYGAKRAIGLCLHDNTNTVIQNICTFNLPGQYINSPKPGQVYALVSACMDYHHMRLHKLHYDEALKEKLVLYENYIRAMDGITEEVQEFFDKITVRNA